MTECAIFYIFVLEVSMKKEYYIITKTIDGVIRYITETHFGLKLTDNIFSSAGFTDRNMAERTLKNWQESWSIKMDLTDAKVRKITITME